MTEISTNKADEASLASRLVVLYCFPSAVNFEAHWKERVLRTAEIEGAEVHVVLPQGPEALQKDTFPSVEFHRIPFRRGMFSFRFDFLTIACLVYLLIRVRPTLVHAVTIKPVIYAGILTRFFGIEARVFSITGLGYAFIAGSPFRSTVGRLARSGYRMALGGKNVRVIFENPDDEAVFIEQGIVGDEISRVHVGGGLDTNDFACGEELETDSPKVVLAGRMLKDKGVFEFVEAARRIKQKGVRAEFQLVGDADELNPATISRQQLRDWDSEGFVRWLGWRDNIVDILGEANIVCLPSYREGAPRVLMEAMACGRACVATDVPGCRHVLRAEETGVLVPPRDAGALAAAIERLIVDKNLRRSMGERGRRVAVKEFCHTGASDFVLSVYGELLPLDEQGRFGDAIQDCRLA